MYVRAADRPAAPDRAARAGLCAGDAGAGCKRNRTRNFGAGLAGADCREGDAAAKIEPTYSNTAGISRARPALRALIVCIIQVK